MTTQQFPESFGLDPAKNPRLIAKLRNNPPAWLTTQALAEQETTK